MKEGKEACNGNGREGEGWILRERRRCKCELVMTAANKIERSGL